MTWPAFLQIAVFLGLLSGVTKPLGVYMAAVFAGRRMPLARLEGAIYRICGVDPATDQPWTAYAAACLLFSVVNFALFYALLRFQPALGTRMTPDLAFNTAVSFMTNTSWQAYAGETTLTHISQMLGVAVQSFTSAAAGLAVAIALIRGFLREKTSGLGNFWVDIVRASLYILLPLSLLGALFLCGQGVIQNLQPNRVVTTVEGASQTIPFGPVASQEAIKLLSSDGGGFFNANSAHPFENPTPVGNIVEMLFMLAIPAGMTYTFGRLIRDQRQGWTIFAAMMLLFAAGTLIATWSEQSGHNMEGKEVRFGASGSALFSMVSTTSSDGAVDSSHDSYTPISGLVQILNLTEVIFGGAGSGLVSMLFMVIVTVFLAGLMVGRTPEYLGKRIEAREMKMVMLSFVATGIAVLIFSAATFVVQFAPGSYWNPAGPPTANLGDQGAHGVSEVLYANASAVATNGSAFAGLNANSPWFNFTLALEMLIGRFFVINPALAEAGSIARKPRLAITAGTMPTHGRLFTMLLLASIVLIAALTFFPALSLGPIAEHFLMTAGH